MGVVPRRVDKVSIICRNLLYDMQPRSGYRLAPTTTTLVWYGSL